MAEPRKGWDPKCGDLADYFLRDILVVPKDIRDSLAQAIQDAVEEWHEYNVEQMPIDEAPHAS